MSHTCHAEGCDWPVPPRMFACRDHWRMVERPLQRALWTVYREGQESDKRVTSDYLVVQTLCRLDIARAEHQAGAFMENAGSAALAHRMVRICFDLNRLTGAHLRWAHITDPRERISAALKWARDGCA